VKIALITDAWFPQINGVVTTLNHVKEELESLGHEFLVIHPGLFRTFPCPKYPEIRLCWMPGRKVAALLRDFAPDAIHIATEGPLGLAGRRWAIRGRHPFTTSYHTQFPHYLHDYFRIPQAWTYRAMRWFHGQAGCVLVPTPGVKDELEARGFERIKVWTRGVNTELFKPREKNFFPDPRPIFLYCGRVSSEKNIEAFLEADLPGTKVIVGDGPAMGTMRKRYPAARFVGFKRGEELAQHFAAADVFVFPSRTDTFGVVMLEAMASGLPVAAYPVTGPIDVVQPGVSGVLDEDLAKAAREALALDPQACRAYALEFSWRRCAEMFLDNLAPLHDRDALPHASS
jgi:glycosyltransferase involved in cell wall biosynthesis